MFEQGHFLFWEFSFVLEGSRTQGEITDMDIQFNKKGDGETLWRRRFSSTLGKREG